MIKSNVITTMAVGMLMLITNSVALAEAGVRSTDKHTHVINAEARVFNPDIHYISPGDTVNFTNMTSHNAVSYIFPEGSKPFGEKGKLPGGSFSITLDVEGIYGYICEPHVGFGMVGVIVVGDVSSDDIEAAKKRAMDSLKGPFRRLIGKINKVEPTTK